MSSDKITGEVVYIWKSFNLTKIVDYGVSFDTLRSAKPVLPPEGARFDAYFEGVIKGPKLKGTISCADYIHVRADGRIQLHIHGEITTDDGEKIALFADGISTYREGASNFTYTVKSRPMTERRSLYSPMVYLLIERAPTFTITRM